MNKPLRIGLTGGIASGKSYISNLFKSYSVSVIDADEIARSLFEVGSDHLSALRQKFGDAIFNQNGSLNRKALGKIVFNSSRDLDWLNQFTHPLVRQEIERQLSFVSSSYVILDIPLLIDKSGEIPAHLKTFVDRILVIDLQLESQIKRLCTRDEIDRTHARSIIETQSSIEQKLKLADDVIDNNGEIEALAPQVEKLHQFYLNLAASLPQ